MGIFDRLGSVISSYFNDFSNQTSSRYNSPNSGNGDPDLDAAYDELNDFLNRKDSRFEKEKPYSETSGREKSNQYSWRDADTGNDSRQAKSSLPPEDLRADFEIMGVPFGADEETCKLAYKKQIKIHHPDRHAGHEGNYKKATARTARINAAWNRIEKYYKLAQKK